jgi:6-phosphogluconate dehydrogenase
MIVPIYQVTVPKEFFMNTTSQPTIAVLGTGLMGAPIARNLHKRGFAVRAWNRTAAKAQALPCVEPTSS